MPLNRGIEPDNKQVVQLGNAGPVGEVGLAFASQGRATVLDVGCSFVWGKF